MKKLFLIALMALSCCTLLAQNRVTGKVTSSGDGEPIPFASIAVKGTMLGTSSDADGNYVLTGIPAGATLVYSSIGFKDQEVAVDGRSVINVMLDVDVDVLEETIVVGYGTAKKISSVVGASTLVKSDAFTKIPAASAGDALQGKVAGLQVYTSSGEPSAAVSMRLRGVNSINASNTPLFILDGTPVDVAIFTALNPNDIENVTVMKDASSTAIYGSRAANGVVYITTKKG
ncbi:MAG: TonB-dependent receptor plug domain-containing protein, partial [Bacteroidales bacterium]|nr:TonB-dependent receptor plug domain-containing protein [Bacteroidales bacterium]